MYMQRHHSAASRIQRITTIRMWRCFCARALTRDIRTRKRVKQEKAVRIQC
eukprot:gene42983-43824_t